MCFIKKLSLREDEYKEITEVLNNDLIVFKIIDKVTTRFSFIIKRTSYYAPFYHYKYKKKKVNTSHLDIAIRKEANAIIINVDSGFHSFRTLRDLKKSPMFSIPGYSIAKFIIPKGSTVIVSDTQIVSNQIIFIEELK